MGIPDSKLSNSGITRLESSMSKKLFYEENRPSDTNTSYKIPTIKSSAKER